MGNKFRNHWTLGLVFFYGCILVAVTPLAPVFGHSESSPPSSVVKSASGFGGPFALVNHKGKAVRDDDFRGKIMIVYFGYTHCPDICPIDAQNIGKALDLLGDRTSLVQPLFITVDPNRDGPARLAVWLGAIHPGFIGLTGTPKEIAAIAKAYKVVFNRVERAGGYDYTFNHPGLTYVMGVDGRFLFLIPPGTSPEAIAQVIRSVMPARK